MVVWGRSAGSEKGLATAEGRTLIRASHQGQCQGRHGGWGPSWALPALPCCSPTLTACQAADIQASGLPLPLSVAGIIITGKDNKDPGCLKPHNGVVLRLLLLPLPGLGRDQPYTIRIMAISGSSPSLLLPPGWRAIRSRGGAWRSEVLG